MPDEPLTPQEIEAITTVVSRLARGRGTWFDVEATLIRFGKVAEKNLGFRSQVVDAACNPTRSCPLMFKGARVAGPPAR